MWCSTKRLGLSRGSTHVVHLTQTHHHARASPAVSHPHSSSLHHQRRQPTRDTETMMESKGRLMDSLSPSLSMTTAALAAGVVMHTTALVLPFWAAGETYHLASSSAFQVEVTAGLWGYCRTATLVDAIPAVDHKDCYAFHSTIGRQEISVCEAFARGFVYGTDDVRGIRLPVNGIHDVRRIERPPTSLDDENLRRFLERSCGVEGISAIVLSSVSLVLAALTLVAFLWSLAQNPKQCSFDLTQSMRANASITQFSSLAAFAAVVMWLIQSFDLRQSEFSGGPASIYLGHAAYMQVLVAILYCIGGLGMLSVSAEQLDRSARATSMLRVLWR